MHFCQQVIFATHMAIQSTLGDASPIGDVPRGRVHITDVAEQVNGGLEYPNTGLFSFQLRWSTCRRRPLDISVLWFHFSPYVTRSIPSKGDCLVAQGELIDEPGQVGFYIDLQGPHHANAAVVERDQ